MAGIGSDQRAGRDTAPAGSAQAASVGTTYQQGRAVHIVCTVAGNVTVNFPDGTTLLTAVAANTVYEYNWAITGIASSGTTATATYYILY